MGKQLALKVGAQVLLLKNLNTAERLCNGAKRVAVEFCHLHDSHVQQFAGSASSSSSATDMWPMVRFAATGQERVMGPDVWDIKVGGEVVAKRTQVPLALAWAITIHKCQGMTLDRIETNLSKAFGCSMVYVALSRVRSLKGLHLTGFDPSKIKVILKRV